jgi:hypothetical protein
MVKRKPNYDLEAEYFWFIVICLIIIVVLLALILRTPDVDAFEGEYAPTLSSPRDSHDLDLDNGLEFRGQFRSNDAATGQERDVTIYKNSGDDEEDISVTHDGAVTHGRVRAGEEATVITFPGSRQQPVIIIAPSKQ